MIIVVDDEEIAREGTKTAVSTVLPAEEILTFSSSRAAFEYAEGNPVSCAFLDITMPVLDGVKLAKKIKLIQPACNIVFTTGFDSYYSEAFSLGASDYLLKPITPDKIRHALSQLRSPLRSGGEKAKIKCFGNFDIFYGGVPVKFKRAKSKEMLAYLVSRDGASVTKNELMANLFEKDDSSYYGVLKKDLTDTLNMLGIGDVLIKTWKTLAIDKTRVECDYFQFLEGNPGGLNSYRGEFMSQYSWAEFMCGGMTEL